VGQVAKYVPGSIWVVVAQAELGRSVGVPRRLALTASVLTPLVFLSSGLVLGGGILLVVASDVASAYRGLLLLAPFLLVGLHPRVVNAFVARCLRVLRREPLERPLTGRGIGAALAWSVLTWVLYGLHIGALVWSFGVSVTDGLLFGTGGFAVAWCVGLVIIAAPAGAGVRDIALVLALAPLMERGEAIAVALSSRFIITIADLAAAAALGLFTRHLARGQLGWTADPSDTSVRSSEDESSPR
jgi:hypothetical protein